MLGHSEAATESIIPSSYRQANLPWPYCWLQNVGQPGYWEHRHLNRTQVPFLAFRSGPWDRVMQSSCLKCTKASRTEAASKSQPRSHNWGSSNVQDDFLNATLCLAEPREQQNISSVDQSGKHVRDCWVSHPRTRRATSGIRRSGSGPRRQSTLSRLSRHRIPGVSTQVFWETTCNIQSDCWGNTFSLHTWRSRAGAPDIVYSSPEEVGSCSLSPIQVGTLWRKNLKLCSLEHVYHSAPWGKDTCTCTRRAVSLWLLFSIDIDWRNLHRTETTWVLLEVGARMQRRWCSRRPCFCVKDTRTYENFFNETSHMRQEGVSIETSTWISKHTCPCHPLDLYLPKVCMSQNSW